MACLILSKRCLIQILLACVVFAAYMGLSQAGMYEWVTRCCVKGQQKAKEFKGLFDVCDTDDLHRRPFDNVMDRMVCRVAERVCCIKDLQKIACERGKYQASQGKSCARINGYAGSDSYIECCDCCTLGIKARSSGTGCDQLVLNRPCEKVYKECCSGEQVTALPYSTQPAPIRSQSPSTPPTGQGCVPGFCQHICREDRDRKPVCYCYNGYFIASDKKKCLDVDECVMSVQVCSSDQRCINTQGSYRCVVLNTTTIPVTTAVLSGCSSVGYELVRGSCQDLNECTRGTSTCSRQQRCVNTPGSYRCTCDRGYKVSGQHCVDKDECATREARCPPGTVCRNLPGRFICSRPELCPAGKRKTSQGCVDVDECTNGASPCDSDTRCINTDGSYRCVPCGKGFQPRNNRCVDKNECTNGEAVCRRGTVCKNTLGSYTCSRTKTCPAGKQRTSSGCIDIDECARNIANCIGNTRCVNTDGSYQCLPCQTGTRPQNNVCTDIDECSERRYRCEANQKCENTVGSYRCVADRKACLSGYKNVAGKCVDVDECVEYNIKCPNGNECKNEPGSYSCAKRCSNGFKVVNGRCEDIDECVEFRITCPSGQRCSNLPGTYRCVITSRCPGGFEFRNGRCLDLDECIASSSPCSARQRCENFAGSYRCVSLVVRCLQGYVRVNGKCVVRPCPGGYIRVNGKCVVRPCPRGYNRVNGKCVVADASACASTRCRSGHECKLEQNRPVCKDIDECLKRPCKNDEICVNQPGRYFCKCQRGYSRNQYTQRCEDINECQRRHCEHGCVNTPPGSFTCSCQKGFELHDNKVSCKDVNECLTQKPCQGRCTNTIGSYVCYCDPGYKLAANGQHCEDVDECKRFSTGQLCTYRCVNLPGTYRCECPAGYELKANNHQCMDIDECAQNPNICGVGTICRNTNGYHRCIPFSCRQPYYQLEGDNKCSRKCPTGDQRCYQLKEKVYQFWTFQLTKGTPRQRIFSYRIIASGYKNPDIRYRIRSGNELGHFEIRRPPDTQNVSEIWTTITLQEPREYVLDFVGELYDGFDLLSVFVHTLYVFVSLI